MLKIQLLYTFFLYAPTVSMQQAHLYDPLHENVQSDMYIDLVLTNSIYRCILVV